MGLKCRSHDQGTCEMLHEDAIDAKQDPLICPFWADNERCRKPATQCRFAHYWAQHDQVAPAPHFKGSKKPKDGKVPSDSKGVTPERPHKGRLDASAGKSWIDQN